MFGEQPPACLLVIGETFLNPGTFIFVAVQPEYPGGPLVAGHLRAAVIAR